MNWCDKIKARRNRQILIKISQKEKGKKNQIWLKEVAFLVLVILCKSVRYGREGIPFQTLLPFSFLLLAGFIFLNSIWYDDFRGRDQRTSLVHSANDQSAYVPFINALVILFSLVSLDPRSYLIIRGSIRAASLRLDFLIDCAAWMWTMMDLKTKTRTWWVSLITCLWLSSPRTRVHYFSEHSPSMLKLKILKRGRIVF